MLPYPMTAIFMPSAICSLSCHTEAKQPTNASPSFKSNRTHLFAETLYDETSPSISNVPGGIPDTRRSFTTATYCETESVCILFFNDDWCTGWRPCVERFHVFICNIHTPVTTALAERIVPIRAVDVVASFWMKLKTHVPFRIWIIITLACIQNNRNFFLNRKCADRCWVFW